MNQPFADQIFTKDDPKVINAWCSYDWANSVYNLIITSAIFPFYYTDVTKGERGDGMISFLGYTLPNSALYGYAISFSFLVIVALSPVLSGIADYGGTKKRFMRFFTFLGAFSCIGLYGFEGPNLYWGLGCAVMASVGYAGSLVFYNAFLHEIASSEQVDRVSARGFSMGYLGSVILLIVCLMMIIPAEDADKTEITRRTFIMVGIWWLAFSQIAFYYLKDRPTGHRVSGRILAKGFDELGKVWRRIQAMHTLRWYLLAFFFYSMGVQAIMLLAPLFGTKELGMKADNLIITVLVIQLVAIAGAYLFAFISQKIGNFPAILTMLVIWLGICGAAYFVQNHEQFYVVAGAVGLVMGGIQSLSRSTYSKLIPEDTADTASFFSFYDVTEKLAIVIGTASYSLIEQVTSSMRDSAIGMMGYFVVGILLLLYTNFTKKI